MINYIDATIDILDNKIKSVYTSVTKNDNNYPEWVYTHYREKPEYISDIVANGEIKGVLLNSKSCDYTFRQTIKSDSIVEAVDIAVQSVQDYVLNNTHIWKEELKAKEISRIEAQAQELIDKANKLRGSEL